MVLISVENCRTNYIIVNKKKEIYKSSKESFNKNMKKKWTTFKIF